jgi:hypothetical protein
MSGGEIEEVIARLRRIDVEFQEAKRRIEELEQAQSHPPVEDDLDDQPTRRLTREQVVLSHEVKPSRDPAVELAEKLIMREGELAALREQLATAHTARKALAERFSRLTGAILRLKTDPKLTAIFSKAIMYYLVSPTLDSFRLLLAGEQAVAGDIPIAGGRSLDQGALLDDTQSGLAGLAFGQRGISLHERYLKLEDRFRTIFAAWLHHQLMTRLNEQGEMIRLAVTDAILEDLRQDVPFTT